VAQEPSEVFWTSNNHYKYGGNFVYSLFKIEGKIAYASTNGFAISAFEIRNGSRMGIILASKAKYGENISQAD